jgi:surface polysaccharide O-acyltransferase-like enzyme
MHYFRAFAIINVIFAHTLMAPDIEAHTLLGQQLSALSRTIFHDSTIYFIFISGFLFHHLSSRFELKKYYKSKILNVLFPYIVLTTVILLYRLATDQAEGGIETYSEYLLQGKAQVQYWYIPFITVVFLISPLLLKIPERIFIPAVSIGCLLPLLGTRTTVDITLGQYNYFLPIYGFGMLCSLKYEQFVDFCNKYVKQAAIIAITFTIIIYYCTLNNIYASYGYLNSFESLFYIHKMAIICVAVFVLQKLKNKDIKTLDIIAKYSFAAYFLHILVQNKLIDPICKRILSIPVGSTNWPAVVFMGATIGAAATILISIMAKKMLGKHSRKIIGA